jgi:hypothetical protein
VLFTDEARFSRDAIINILSLHHPHGVIHSRHQQQFSMNVLAGIVRDCLLGPHVLPHQFTGNPYWDFLVHDLPELLEDVLVAVRARMWSMHDGASAHFGRGEMFSITLIMTNE